MMQKAVFFELHILSIRILPVSNTWCHVGYFYRGNIACNVAIFI